MSHPPGSPDPDASGDRGDGAPADPWATPTGGRPREHLSYPPPAEPGLRQYEQSPYPPYAQPPHGQPPYPAYGYPPRPNGKAQAAMWTGIGLLVLSCCAAGVFGVVPIVLGV
jgi:hypothetical protein